MSKITIYHNPQCSNSRGAFALMRQRGLEPEVIEYLKDPPTREKLVELIARMGIRARDLIVEMPLGTRLCRPPETVLEILPQSRKA